MCAEDFYGCGIDDLRCKEVIDIATGERLGNIDDAEINLETAEVCVSCDLRQTQAFRTPCVRKILLWSAAT